MGTDAEVEAVLAGELGQRLVGSDTGSLKSLRGELLTLIGHKVHNKRELVDRGALGTVVVDADLRV